MYAEDISRCTSTPCRTNDSEMASTVFEDSLFNLLADFEDSHDDTNTTR